MDWDKELEEYAARLNERDEAIEKYGYRAYAIAQLTGNKVTEAKPDPTVYNRWCDCFVNAREVLKVDPSIQNEEFRADAQAAVDIWYKRMDGPRIEYESGYNPPRSSGQNGTSTLTIVGFGFSATVSTAKIAHREIVRQTIVNNGLRKSGVALDAVPKVPKVAKFLGTWGGRH